MQMRGAKTGEPFHAFRHYFTANGGSQLRAWKQIGSECKNCLLSVPPRVSERAQPQAFPIAPSALPAVAVVHSLPCARSLCVFSVKVDKNHHLGAQHDRIERL